MELAQEIDNTAVSVDAKATDKHIPGEAGVWVLVLGDAFVFVLLFVSFLAYRSQALALYSDSQNQLNMHLGAVNTLLLLASSWFVVTALHALRRELQRLAMRLFQLAWLSGFGFGVVKVIEYSEKFEQGITPLTNSFFMFYFVLTGIHFIHLLIGLGVLAFMMSVLKRSKPGERRLATLESGATYWHLVDLLWIVLFPLLYLVR
ncbi:nitric oxide reductase NorE protein [Litorivivens lipolytica]|uniref:Nitric oxide reductase NorE protein n=1 Tax=Litorivivens lipolytica TaxID=1524264 RepID=A0A7W4W1T6_9GAMM|nr:cytochrome c oxidase subunit 3 [Litorivivens lipolytica]MBB3045834.1 nitric oxide reductase NorE protein [Litorivivens lipolytica]